MADRQRPRQPVRKDPWARFEAWRDAPETSKRANLRRALPGFWWGLGAFVFLVAVEELYWKPNHPNTDHDHCELQLDHIVPVLYHSLCYTGTVQGVPAKRARTTKCVL